MGNHTTIPSWCKYIKLSPGLCDMFLVWDFESRKGSREAVGWKVGLHKQPKRVGVGGGCVL